MPHQSKSRTWTFAIFRAVFLLSSIALLAAAANLACRWGEQDTSAPYKLALVAGSLSIVADILSTVLLFRKLPHLYIAIVTEVGSLVAADISIPFLLFNNYSSSDDSPNGSEGGAQQAWLGVFVLNIIVATERLMSLIYYVRWYREPKAARPSQLPDDDNRSFVGSISDPEH